MAKRKHPRLIHHRTVSRLMFEYGTDLLDMGSALFELVSAVNSAEYGRAIGAGYYHEYLRRSIELCAVVQYLTHKRLGTT